MPSLKEILAAIELHRERLCDLGVRELAVFGSAARDEATPESDLDFLVAFDKKTFRSYMDTKFLLEDIFGCSGDLVLKDTIRPGLAETILREAVHAPGL